MFIILKRCGFIKLVIASGVIFTNLVYAETIEKADGRFSFTANTYQLTSPNLVNEISLQAEWWTLLGQPVEYYKLKWELADSFRYGEDYSSLLSLSDLRGHSDLIERYNDLKPIDIKLNIGVKLYMGEGHFNIIDKHEFYRWSGGTQAIGTRTVSRTPHLMINNAGTVGDNITPMSPENWQNFISYGPNAMRSYLQVRSHHADKNIEVIAKDTFKYADLLYVDRLEVVSIILPNSEGKAIHDELKRREKNAENEEDEPEVGSKDTEDDFSESESIEDEANRVAELKEKEEEERRLQAHEDCAKKSDYHRISVYTNRCEKYNSRVR